MRDQGVPTVALLVLFYVVLPSVGLLIAWAVAAHWRHQQRPRIDAARKAAAERLGGAYDGRAIAMEVGGRAARVDFVEAALQRHPYTQVSIDLKGKSPGALHVFRREPPESLRVLFGGRQAGASSGDAAFDERYVIHATPPGVAEAFFAAPRRAWVIAALRGLEPIGEPALEIARERLLVRVSRDLEDERRIRTLTGVAMALYEYVTDAMPSGVAWMEAAEGLDARCGVCMTGMEASVRCAKCRTPHHRDCWEFTGLCSTFACGSRDRA